MAEAAVMQTTLQRILQFPFAPPWRNAPGIGFPPPQGSRWAPGAVQSTARRESNLNSGHTVHYTLPLFLLGRLSWGSAGLSLSSKVML